MSKRVFLGSLATETNTFSPLRTNLQDFKDSFYAGPGEHPQTPTLCSAVYTVARSRAAELGWDLIEGTATWAEPGGVVSQQCWTFLRDQLLAELKAAMPVDIVLLGLHGAMVSQECLDCEGELLKAVRQMVGPDVIVGVTFDPHSHLSQDRVENADLITVFKEFPHTDFVTIAEDLVEMTRRMSAGEIKPVISTFDCRMIEVLPTSREPMRSFVDRIKALEGTGNILSISVIHGFMAGDVPDLGTRILVITDSDETGGADLAERLGRELYAMRGTTRPEFLDVETALGKVAASQNSPVVIADVWDNPGGGVPGDSTTILRALIAGQVANAAVATIWDPIAVRTCFSAGEGAELMLRFGAKMAANAGEPIDAMVKVRRVVPDAFQRFGKSLVPMGDSVWIEVGGVDVVLNTVRSQVFSPDVFSAVGIEPSAKKLLVVKSTNHFYDAFSRISDEILYVAIDGTYPNNPITTPYRHLTRNIWPRTEDPYAD